MIMEVTFFVKSNLNNKYFAEIDKYARIYADLDRVTDNLGGYVFISNSRYFDWEKDSSAFSPHSYMLYFEVKLDVGSPGAVRDYYENRYAYAIPYDEKMWKKKCLDNNFKDCNNIDKDVLWDCILDEILDNKCEKRLLFESAVKLYFVYYCLRLYYIANKNTSEECNNGHHYTVCNKVEEVKHRKFYDCDCIPCAVSKTREKSHYD